MLSQITRRVSSHTTEFHAAKLNVAGIMSWRIVAVKCRGKKVVVKMLEWDCSGSRCEGIVVVGMVWTVLRAVCCGVGMLWGMLRKECVGECCGGNVVGNVMERIL